MLTAAYHMLKNGVECQDLGADHFSRRDRSKAIQRFVRRLNDLGCEVQLIPQAA
jgi:transposase